MVRTALCVEARAGRIHVCLPPLTHVEDCINLIAAIEHVAEALGAPVYQQTVQYAAHFLSEHPAFVGHLTRSQQQVREALAPYDLLVFLGADQLRMSLWSSVDPMPEGGQEKPL